MQVLKTFSRFFSSLLLVILPIWGGIISDEQLVIFFLIAFIAVINLVVGFKESRESYINRVTLAEIKSGIVELSRPVPVSDALSNLGELKNSELKHRVELVVSDLREFAGRAHEALNCTPWWAGISDVSKLHDDDRNGLFWAHTKRENDHRARVQKEFLDRYRPVAQALWNELSTRITPAEGHQEAAFPFASGMLAGFRPIDSAANDLEILARRLPDA